MIGARRKVRQIRRERDVVVHAARWLLEENERLRSRLQDALAEVARRPHPDDIGAAVALTKDLSAHRIAELEKELDLADAARCRCGCRKPDVGPKDDAKPGEW